MGLLSRIGKEFIGDFGEAGFKRREGRAPTWLETRHGTPWTLNDYTVGAPGMYGAMGGGAGALFGAIGATPPGGMSEGDGAIDGALRGAGIVGGGALALGSPVVMKRMVMAIARALTKKGLPENDAIMAAQQIASKPDAWKQLQRFGINDPRDLGID